jgi:peptidoglycan/LPS O-acetylase OafA/YrhL
VLFHIDNFVASVRPDPALRNPVVHQLLGKGYIGVQIFFAISGFVLALPFAQHHRTGAKPIGLRRYYLRRITRLEPTYMINLVIMWIAKASVKGASLLALAPHFVASMFYIHYPVYGTPSTVNAVAWSLEIEVQFYILTPVLTLVFAIQRTRVRRGVLIGAIMLIAGTLAWRGPLENHQLTLLQQLHYFLIGFLLVDLYLLEWRVAPTMPRAWDVGATGGWLAIPLALVFAPRAAHVIVPLAIFLAFGGALRGRVWTHLMSNPWLFTIGGTCYTIYLYNNQLITTFGRVTARLAPPSVPYPAAVLIQVIVMSPLVLAVSALLFVLFERPFMRRTFTAIAPASSRRLNTAGSERI